MRIAMYEDAPKSSAHRCCCQSHEMRLRKRQDQSPEYDYQANTSSHRSLVEYASGFQLSVVLTSHTIAPKNMVAPAESFSSVPDLQGFRHYKAEVSLASIERT